MRALKVLVIVMGVLIIVGTGVVVAVIAARITQNRGGIVGSAAVTVPKGAHIEAISNSADRVVLALVLADGSRQLLVIDLAHGRTLATIALRPAP